MKLYPRMPVVIFFILFLRVYDGAKENREELKPVASSSPKNTAGIFPRCAGKAADSLPEYTVARIDGPLTVDGNWEKQPWHDTRSIEITNVMGETPVFSPRTEVKMLYDDENIFIVFRVHDKYVQSLVQEVNGPVYQDACVEFFFSPGKKTPGAYFDLEINCGGIPLICYVPREREFTKSEIGEISIAHSMPKLVYPEIRTPVTWVVECRIPLALLEKFTGIARPGKGVCWRGNFFKTAAKGSNPHYLTWAVVKSDKPNFHLPQYFGKLRFM